MNKQYPGRRLWMVVRLLAWLPLPLVTGFGAAIATLVTLVPLRYASAYRVVLINLLATHPQLSYAEAKKIGRQRLRELGRTPTEFSHVRPRPGEGNPAGGGPRGFLRGPPVLAVPGPPRGTPVPPPWTKCVPSPSLFALPMPVCVRVTSTM